MLKKYHIEPTANNPHPKIDVGTVWVEFVPDTGSIGVSQMKKFVQFCDSHNHKSGIMVTNSAISAQARRVINGARDFAYIEVFLEEDLLVNITRHELVPRHILLSREEKAALLKRYHLKETQLPRILSKDPIARYLGLKRGNVVKIIRDSETAGRYASYRLCV